MRIHQNKHHYRSFKKNPFLGGGTRVFMAIENAARLLEDHHFSWSTAQTIEQPLAKALREQMERRRKERLNENGEPYRAELNAQTYQEWESSLASLQAVHAYRGWIDKQMKYISGESEPPEDGTLKRPFDLRDSAWHMRVRNIYKSYADGDAHMSALGSIGDGYRQALQSSLQGQVDEAKKQILTDCRFMLEQTEKAGIQVENEIKKQMREDFENRLLWLRTQWEQNPPKDYAANIPVRDAQIAFIDQVRTSLTGSMSDSVSFKEYRAVWADLDQIEAFYSAGKRADLYLNEHIETLSQQGLEARLEEVEAKRAAAVLAVKEQHAQEMEKALASMRAYYSTVASLPEDAQHFKIQTRPETGPDGVEKEVDVIPCTPDEKGEYKEGTKGYVLAQIQKRIDDLEKYGSLEDATRTVLSDPNKTRGVKKVQIPSADGTSIKEIEVPNSIEGQIAFVFDPTNGLNEAERSAIAMGIHEALANFEKRIEDPQMLMGNLGQIQEQCSQNISNLGSQEEKIAAETADRGYSVYWVAPYDAVRAWEIVTGWWDRTYQRRVNKRLSKLGSDALKPLGTGPITILRTLPNEFNKQGEDAERNEVQQFQDAYANKDYWQIEEIAIETQNQDELKACLNLLSGAGRLRWDNPKLIRQFNTFQSVFHISENMGMHYANPSQFYEELDRACGYIWDNDTFKGWDRANSGNYNSKGKDYDAKLTAASETGGGVGTMMENMLKEWKQKGKAAKFDPLLYDRGIGYSIEQGKMGSEEKLYYLIQGIAYDIIPFERGSHYTSLNNVYPAIEFFARGSNHKTLGYEGKVSMPLIRKVAEMDKASFTDWWHYYVMNLPMVRQRLDKAITGGGKMDHDDLTPFFPYMGVKTIEQCLGQNATGGFTVPQTGLENATVGMEFYMRNFAEHRLHGDEIEKQMVDLKQFGEFAQTFVFFNGAVRNRLYKGRNNIFRFNHDVMGKKPRSHDAYEALYGYKGQTVQTNLDNVERWMTNLEPDFFGPLFSDTLQDSQVAALSLNLQRKYGASEHDLFGGPITKVDDLHLATSKFVSFLIERNPDSVRNMLLAVNAENEKSTKTRDLRRSRAEFKKVLMEESPPPQFATWAMNNGVV